MAWSGLLILAFGVAAQRLLRSKASGARTTGKAIIIVIVIVAGLIVGMFAYWAASAPA